MTKAKISEYDASAGNNTDVNNVNIAEGCAPSGINNAIREVMAALKRFETGADGDSVTVGGNLVVSGSATLATTAISSADINAGTIDGTTIGGSSAAVGTFTTANATTVDTTNLEVTNIKAKDGTAAATIADSTGKITVAGQMTIDGIEVGQGAGNVATNTAVGVSALAANTTGTNTVAIGYQALAANTASNNTAVGFRASQSNTTGTPNVAIGAIALQDNTTGSGNTAVGYGSLADNTTASDNSAFGREALRLNTTGASNTAIGRLALYNNTTASSNTAVGYRALYANTTGTQNVAVGTNALDANTTAGGNTAVGYDAGGAITTGVYNTCIGVDAGESITTANDNTMVGRFAGNETTGASNTFIGKNSGYAVTTGTKNTILGSYNGNQGGLDIRTSSNYIVLSDGDGNPRGFFRGSDGLFFSPASYSTTTAAAANMYVDSNGGMLRSTSSLKYKTDVQDAVHGLAEVLQLRSVTYKGKNDGGTIFGGLIAEEVHDAGLTEFVQYAADGTPDALAYGNMVSLCIKAIQELNAKVEAQAAEIAALKGQ